MPITLTATSMTSSLARTVATKTGDNQWTLRDRPHLALTFGQAVRAIIRSHHRAAEAIRASTPIPSGCRDCGIADRDHFQRWTDTAGWHGWTQPTQQQIKDRMHARQTTNTN